MAMKKKSARRQSARQKAGLKKPASRKPVRSTSRPKPRPRTSPAGSSGVSKKAFDAMNERLDIMLPEVMYRIAAIEHLLVQKGFCSHDQLNTARQYIQEQERS